MMTDEEIAAEQALIVTQAEEMSEAVPSIPMGDEIAETATPFDLLNSSNYTTKNIRNERYEVCKGCPEFFNLMKMCKECGCNMPMKTWLKNASCPLDKWGEVL